MTHIDPILKFNILGDLSDERPSPVQASQHSDNFNVEMTRALGGPVKKSPSVDRQIAVLEQDDFQKSVLGDLDCYVEQSDGSIVRKTIIPSTVKVKPSAEDEFMKLAMGILGKAVPPPPVLADKCNCSCMNCQNADCDHCASESKCAVYKEQHQQNAPQVHNPEKDGKRTKKISQGVRNLLKSYRPDLPVDDPDFWSRFEDHFTDYVIGVVRRVSA